MKNIGNLWFSKDERKEMRHLYALQDKDSTKFYVK